MDHPAPDIGELPVDETSEHDLIDLSEFDGLDDLNQAALDALSEVDESDDFGGLLVDTPESVSLSGSDTGPKNSDDES